MGIHCIVLTSGGLVNILAAQAKVLPSAVISIVLPPSGISVLTKQRRSNVMDQDNTTQDAAAIFTVPLLDNGDLSYFLFIPLLPHLSCHPSSRWSLSCL